MKSMGKNCFFIFNALHLLRYFARFYIKTGETDIKK